MPRHRRVSPDGFVQHVVNRGDHREIVFFKPGDFRAFFAVVAEVAHNIQKPDRTLVVEGCVHGAGVPDPVTAPTLSVTSFRDVDTTCHSGS
jgi:hypothetical protein